MLYVFTSCHQDWYDHGSEFECTLSFILLMLFTSSLKNIPHGIQLRIGGSIKVIYRMENVIDSSYFNSETNLKIPQNHVHQKYQTSKGLLEGTFPWVCMVRYKSFCKEFWCVFWLRFYQFQENSKGWVNFSKGNYVVQFLFRFQVEVLEAEGQKRGEPLQQVPWKCFIISLIQGSQYVFGGWGAGGD